MIFEWDENKNKQNKRKLGQMNNMIILFVVYTDRNDKIRLISARKAEADEEAEYYENYDAR